MTTAGSRRSRELKPVLWKTYQRATGAKEQNISSGKEKDKPSSSDSPASDTNNANTTANANPLGTLVGLLTDPTGATKRTLKAAIGPALNEEPSEELIKISKLLNELLETDESARDEYGPKSWAFYKALTTAHEKDNKLFHPNDHTNLKKVSEEFKKFRKFVAHDPKLNKFLSDNLPFCQKAVQAAIEDHTGVLPKTLRKAPQWLLEGFKDSLRGSSSSKKKKTSSAGSGAAAEDEGYGSGLIDLARSAITYLEPLVGKEPGSVSKKISKQFSSVMALGLEEARNEAKGQKGLQELRKAIEKAQRAFENLPEKGGDAKACWNAIHEVMKLGRSANISINGFLLPGCGGPKDRSKDHCTTETLITRNAKALEATLDTNRNILSHKSTNWKEDASIEKDLLVGNVVGHLTLQFVYETLCGLKPPTNQFYLEMLTQSRTVAVKGSSEKGIDDAKLKDFLFKALEKKQVSLFSVWKAMLFYWIYQSVVKTYLSSASSGYFEEIFKYIENQKSDDYNTLRNKVATNLSRYLTILGYSYKAVAKRNSASGTIDEMIGEELEKKEANMGFTTKQLYGEVVRDILQKAIGSSIFAWLIQQLFGSQFERISGLIETSVNSMRDSRGYTHAFNTIVRTQLVDILKIIEDPKTQEKASDPKFSQLRKEEISSLVENFHEVLNYTNCRTPKELKRLIDDKLMSARLTEVFDNLFMRNVLDQVSTFLASTFESLIEKNQLEKTTFEAARLMNQTFELSKPASAKEIEEEEAQISELSSQILKTSVRNIVKSQFDFTGEKEQKEIHDSVKEFHHITFEFIKDSKEKIAELDEGFANSRKGRASFKKITKRALQYADECRKIRRKILGSNLKSANQQVLCERLEMMAKNAKKLVDRIAKTQRNVIALESVKKAAPKLKKIRELLKDIPDILSVRRSTKLTESQLESFDKAVKKIRDLPHCKDLSKYCLKHLEDGIEDVQSIIRDYVEADKIRCFYKEQLEEKSLLEKAVNLKAAELRRSPTTRKTTAETLFNELEQRIKKKIPDYAREHLTKDIEKIRNAKTQTQLERAFKTFRRRARSVIKKADKEKIKLSAAYEKENAKLQGIISTLLKPNSKEAKEAKIQLLQEGVQNIDRSLGRFTKWGKGYLGTLDTKQKWEKQKTHYVPYLNFKPFDMDALQDNVSNFVADRIQSKAHKTLGFFKKSYNLKNGLIIHGLINPLVQARGIQPN